MDRRLFLRDAAGAVGGLAVIGPFSPLIGSALSAAQARPDLAVAKGTPADKIVRAAIDALGGMKRFISKGDVVVVKPNIGWNRAPEYAANTNPEVVATLVKMCLESGAKKVKVFDRTCNDPRMCYANSGIEAAAKAAGAEVSYVDEKGSQGFRDVPIPGGVAIKSWPIHKDILEADKLINAPIAKDHRASKLTMALKNWMGVMGDDRGKAHQNLNAMITDLALIIKPCLTLLDAIRVLTAHGPTGGNLEDVKRLDTVVAGVDQVAIDAYGATLFGLTGEDLVDVKDAAARGLGKMDLSKLTIKKIEV
jgi:uncharacterized protein (DUF362 family)